MNHPLYNNQKNNKSLGRGLSSLIPDQGKRQSRTRQAVEGAPYFPKKNKGISNSILYINPRNIKANPYQPRKDFNEKAINDLKDSIRKYGILQPLIVTQTMAGGYELVAGERRLRAALELNLKSVPVIARTARDLEKLELSLIENIQREDLNPIERAKAYKQMIDNFGLTQEQAASRLGVARSSLNNSLRLLSLSSEVQTDIANARISEGQAKAMLSLPVKKRESVFKKAKQSGMTVRDIENEAKKIKIKSHTRIVNKNLQHKSLEGDMQRFLSTRVLIKNRGKQGGIIEIEFYSDEELKNIVNNILNPNYSQAN